MRPLRPRSSVLLDSNDARHSSVPLLHADLSALPDQLASAARSLMIIEREFYFDDVELVREINADELNYVLTLRSMRTPFGLLTANERLEQVINRDAEIIRTHLPHVQGGAGELADRLEALILRFRIESSTESLQRPMLTRELALNVAGTKRRFLVRRLQLREQARSPFVNLEGGDDEKWQEQYVITALSGDKEAVPMPELTIAGNEKAGSLTWVRRFGFFGGNCAESTLTESTSSVGAVASSVRIASSSSASSSTSGHPSPSPGGPRRRRGALNPWRLEPLFIDVIWRGVWSKRALQLKRKLVQIALAENDADIALSRRSVQRANDDLRDFHSEMKSLQEEQVPSHELEDAITTLNQSIDEAKGELLYHRQQLQSAQAASQEILHEIERIEELIEMN